MNEVFLLFKVQLLGFFGINSAIKSKDPTKKRKSNQFLLVAGISFLAFAYLSTQYSLILASTFKTFGVLRMMPQMMFTASTLLLLVVTAVKSASILFGSKDNDILMALPVKTGHILASRVLVIYATEALYALFLLVPMGIVYAVYAHPGFAYYPCLILLVLFAPILPIVISCFFGTISSYIASFFKKTTFFQTFFQMVLVFGIMALSFSTQGGANPEKMLNIGNKTASLTDKIYPFTSLFVKALCDTDIISLIIFIGASTLIFALFCLLLAWKYKKINSALTARHTRSNYKVQNLEAASPFKALFRKELKRFTGSTNYFLNGGIGAIMLLLTVIAVTFFGSKFGIDGLLENEKTAQIVPCVVPFLFGTFICLTCPSASSISLEGKSIWAIKVLPLETKTILMAKAAVTLVFTIVPSLIAAVIMLVRFDFNVLQGIMLFVVPLLYSCLCAFTGLIVNLRFPMLDWKNEITPIKQSTSTFISTLGFMPLSIAPAFLIGALSAYYVPVVAALVAVIAGVVILEYRYICGKKAAAAFAALSI